jgi:uncharacterized protein YbgA (DUF1722 family)/uncharacterized protein YbbK (DUF523 family)
MTSKIQVGISSCLLGNSVRYDGGHKRNRYITDTLSNYFQFVPVCPEVECGLPVPREAMRLVGEMDSPRLLTVRSGVDHTKRMRDFCDRKVAELKEADLCGFIFKSNSPSSGLFRVKVYHPAGYSSIRKGRGLFAAAMAEHFPLLPMEEEGRLQDARLRENFIERVFSYQRWQDFLSDKPDYKKLIIFHTRQKLLIMAHSPRHYSLMGKLVASGKSLPRRELFSSYEALYMDALSNFSTVKKNTNVLQHIMGYFKTNITADEKAELLEVIGAYKESLVPLTVPLTLINHYVRKYDAAYLKKQVYLSPHPSQLMLRGHI